MLTHEPHDDEIPSDDLLESIRQDEQEMEEGILTFYESAGTLMRSLQ